MHKYRTPIFQESSDVLQWLSYSTRVFHSCFSHIRTCCKSFLLLMWLSEMSFSLNQLEEEWKKLFLIWACWGEAVWAGQSCNLPPGIRLDCGVSSLLPCHLLVCVWLRVSMDVCVRVALCDAQTKLASGSLDALQPSRCILCVYFLLLTRRLFIFRFITCRKIAAQSISSPSKHSSNFHWGRIFIALSPYARRDFH